MSDTVRETLEKIVNPDEWCLADGHGGCDYCGAHTDEEPHYEDCPVPLATLALTQLEAMELDREAMEMVRASASKGEAFGWRWNGKLTYGWRVNSQGGQLDPADAILGTQEASDE